MYRDRRFVWRERLRQRDGVSLQRFPTQTVANAPPNVTLTLPDRLLTPCIGQEYQGANLRGWGIRFFSSFRPGGTGVSEVDTSVSRGHSNTGIELSPSVRSRVPSPRRRPPGTAFVERVRAVHLLAEGHRERSMLKAIRRMSKRVLRVCFFIIVAPMIVVGVLASPALSRTKSVSFGQAVRASDVLGGAPTEHVPAAVGATVGNHDEIAETADRSLTAMMLTTCAGQPDGTTCDDGDACTVGETCRSGICLPPVSFAQAAGSPVAVAPGPYFVAIGDWNGDGVPDLAVASNSANTVVFLLGNGGGGFIHAGGVAVGSAPRSIAVGDLNGDGTLDLAVANTNSGNVTILLGDGSGGFSQAPGSPIAVGSFPISVVAGDLNGDGTLDLAVADFLGNESVTILIGNGSGGFSQAAGSPIVVGGNPYHIAVGDLNRDGALDLAVANNSSGRVTILLGTGSGGFMQAAGSPVTVGSAPRFIAVGDLNADGNLDLAVANNASQDVTILLGSGSGGFGEAPGSPVAGVSSPQSIAVGDLNRDGKLDLAVASFVSDSVTILAGNGSGGFAQPAGSPTAVGTRPQSVAVRDLNGDGRLDLVAANNGSNNVSILLNTTTSAQDGTPCNDGNGCTQTDMCQSGTCTGSNPVVCTASDQCHVAGVCNPANGVCSQTNAANGTTCDDGNVCTANDICTEGVWLGSPANAAPAEGDGVVRFARNGGAAVIITWNLAMGATSSDVLRGLMNALPVGPGGGDETCFGGIPGTTLTLTDATNPTRGAGFWYVVRGDNACGEGPYGYQGQNGAPTVPRVSTTCGIACPAGSRDCNHNPSDGCEVATSDPSNCGACGNVCSPGLCCLPPGQCDCQAPMIACNGICVDPLTEHTNCGQCGHTCSAGQACSSGQCVLSCQSGRTNCNGTCIDVLSDESSCGSCGPACPGGTLCPSGQCVVSCQEGLTNCSGTCVNFLSDRSNCGSCGRACIAGAVCSSGHCVLSCQGGQLNCSGMCVNPLTDESNCSSCGTVCPSGHVCSSGQCVVSCQGGQLNCSGMCVNPFTDESNCGSCGTVCPSGHVCSSGQCMLSCQGGRTNCSGTCVDLVSNQNNCGMCGRVCAANQVCSGGTCGPCQ